MKVPCPSPHPAASELTEPPAPNRGKNYRSSYRVNQAPPHHIPLQKVHRSSHQQLTPSPTLPLSFRHGIPSHVPRTPPFYEEYSRMPTDTQRIQKRTPATVFLQISSANQPFITQLAFTETIS